MNVIAPVFAPGAQTSPRVEEALRRLWMKEAAPSRQYELFNADHFSGNIAPEISERRRKVRELHAAGKGAAEIADKIGCGRDRVWADLYVMGLKCNPPTGRGEVARSRRAQVKRLMTRYNMTAKEIAGSLNAKVDTIYRDIQIIKGTLKEPLKKRETKAERAARERQERLAKRKKTLQGVVAEVALQAGLTVQDVTAEGTKRHETIARWICIVVMRDVFAASYLEIGSNLERNHATMIHGEKKARALMQTDEGFRARVIKAKEAVRENEGLL